MTHFIALMVTKLRNQSPHSGKLSVQLRITVANFSGGCFAKPLRDSQSWRNYGHGITSDYYPPKDEQFSLNTERPPPQPSPGR